MEMEEEAGGRGGTGDKANVPFMKDDHEHESLVAYATNILKEESDKEVLKSIVGLLQDLKTNAGLREGLKGFQKYGWAVIRRNGQQKGNYDFKLPDTPTSSSKQTEGKQILDNPLDNEARVMNNELVLKTIFEFSAVNDLKNCRLVCKKWRDLSLSTWRRRAVLHTSRLFNEPASGAHRDENAAIKELETFLSNPERPFQRYDMKFNDEGLGSRTSHKFEKKFMLDVFSTSITHLNLHCADLEMMCLLLTTLPELQVLHLHMTCHLLYGEYKSIISRGGECPFRDLQPETSRLRKLELDISRRFDGNVNFPWKKIFQSVPELTSFHLNLNFSRRSTPFEEILQSFCDARKEGNFSILNLEDLRICPGPGLYARRFAECQFPLQTLCITLEKDDIDNPSSISYLLEAQSGSLESVQYIFGKSNSYCPCPVHKFQQLSPCLPWKVKLQKLKELVLRNDCVRSFHLLSSLDLPKLEKLILSAPSAEADFAEKEGKSERAFKIILHSEDFMGSCFLPNLKTFVNDDVSMNFGETDLRSLAKAMPNLTELCIPFGEGTLPIVYKLWPSLESLHLLATEETHALLDDYAIIGSPFESCDEGLDAESRELNITDLKDLKKFVLETKCNDNDGVGFPQPGRASITDLSAVFGFLQLPKLDILHLETICKFSANVMDALVEHVSEIKFIRCRSRT